MSAITLSGWGQPHDALSVLAPDGVAVDYARHHNMMDALQDITRTGQGYNTAIGWSLGGQLLVRAIAAGGLRPRRLVLIAAPFQFVATPEDPLGMKRDLYDKFHENYARHPLRTLHKAWELICKDDTKADTVRGHMEKHEKDIMLHKHWLRWLEILDGYHCSSLDFSGFPPTLLIHGMCDAVVSPEQSERFAAVLPQVKLVRIDGCGHAPHWHDTHTVQRYIAEHLHV